MVAPHTRVPVWLCILTIAACAEPSDPVALVAPSLAAGGVGRPSVLVNPNSDDRGTARTIQEGIDMVASGGKVMAVPGTYKERVVIDKGLTLEAASGDDDDDDEGGNGQVTIEELTPLGVREAVIQVVTTEPVTIRGIRVHHVGLRGVNNFTATSLPFAVDLTIEHASFLGEMANGGAVSIVNNATQSGGRAHLAIRNSSIHVDAIGVPLGGDVDALVEGNTITAGAACVRLSPTGAGVTVPAGAASNVDVVNNEFTDCGINGANGVNIQGDPGAATTGTVNVVGNTFRYALRTAPPCNTTAITYQLYSGRIEHNSVINAVQSCANLAFPAAAIRIGAGPRAANVSVRFNDIQGNAFAGLLVRANQTTVLDATCNWWGSASGPSGAGTGTGDAIVVETGAATPTVTPFATAPIARTGRTSC